MPVWERDADHSEMGITLNLESTLYASALAMQLLYGVAIRQWSTSWIINSNGRFPLPDSTESNLSEDWALETKEAKAWRKTWEYTLAAYGTGLAAWVLNLTNGNNGGLFHKFFMLSIQAMKFAPLGSLYYLFLVQAKHVGTDAMYTANSTDLDEDSDQKYLFNPGEYDTTDAHYLDSAWIYRSWGYAATSVLTLWVMSTQAAALEKEYFVIQYLKSQTVEMEVQEEEEPAAEEPAEEEEPAFF